MVVLIQLPVAFLIEPSRGRELKLVTGWGRGSGIRT